MPFCFNYFQTGIIARFCLVWFLDGEKEEEKDRNHKIDIVDCPLKR